MKKSWVMKVLSRKIPSKSARFLLSAWLLVTVTVTGIEANQRSLRERCKELIKQEINEKNLEDFTGMCIELQKKSDIDGKPLFYWDIRRDYASLRSKLGDYYYRTGHYRTAIKNYWEAQQYHIADSRLFKKIAACRKANGMTVIYAVDVSNRMNRRKTSIKRFIKESFAAFDEAGENDYYLVLFSDFPHVLSIGKTGSPQKIISGIDDGFRNRFGFDLKKTYPENTLAKLDKLSGGDFRTKIPVVLFISDGRDSRKGYAKNSDKIKELENTAAALWQNGFYLFSVYVDTRKHQGKKPTINRTVLNRIDAMRSIAKYDSSFFLEIGPYNKNHTVQNAVKKLEYRFDGLIPQPGITHREWKQKEKKLLDKSKQLEDQLHLIQLDKILTGLANIRQNKSMSANRFDYSIWNTLDTFMNEDNGSGNTLQTILTLGGFLACFLLGAWLDPFRYKNQSPAPLSNEQVEIIKDRIETLDTINSSIEDTGDAGDGFYRERKTETQLILDGLLERKINHYLVHGPGKVGKSTFLKKLEQKILDKNGPFSNQYDCLYIQYNKKDHATFAQFSNQFHDQLDNLDPEKTKIIIEIDEYDKALEELGVDFYNLLNHFLHPDHYEKQYDVILAGQRNYDLIDKQWTDMIELKTTLIPLEGLDSAINGINDRGFPETRRLLQSYLDYVGFPCYFISPGFTGRIAQLSSGFPYLSWKILKEALTYWLINDRKNPLDDTHLERIIDHVVGSTRPFLIDRVRLFDENEQENRLDSQVRAAVILNKIAMHCDSNGKILRQELIDLLIDPADGIKTCDERLKSFENQLKFLTDIGFVVEHGDYILGVPAIYFIKKEVLFDD